jgi:hypothetical protein
MEEVIWKEYNYKTRHAWKASKAMEDVWVVRSIDTKARPGPHQTVALLLVVDYVRT